jgi:acyl-CoA thioester hydrolase
MRADLLNEYPVIIEIPVAWGEMDSYGHVNNIIYFRHFESARVAYFAQIGFPKHKEETGIGPILASTHCRFRTALAYPDTVSVGARVIKIDSDRFTMDFRTISHKLGKVAAEGQGIIVSYDYRAGHKAPLPPEIRARIEALEGHSFDSHSQTIT